MERDPDIDIERNPARRPASVERATVMATGPAVAPLAARRDDRVHWGPVWAGFIVSMLVMIILGALAAAIGLAAVNPTPAVGTTAATQTGSGVVAAIIVLIALFVGGYSAGAMLEPLRTAWGAAHGVLVSGLVLTAAVLITAFGSIGLGNAMANVFGALNLGRVFDPRVYTTLPPTEIATAAARAAGWFTVIALLCVGAAALGGYLATQRDDRRETRRPTTT